MLTSFFSLFAAIHLVAMHLASAQTLPQRPRQYRTQAFATLDYFNSTANYTSSGGSYKDLPNGGSYKNILTRFGGSYDLDNQWHLLGSLLTSKATSENGTTTRDAFELSELSGVAQYWLMKRPISVVPEFKFTYPLQRVSDSTRDIMTGEGAMALQAGVWVAQKLGPIRGYGYLGFKYQDEGRASLIPWTLAAEYKPQMWFANGGLRGFETLMESSDLRADHEAVTNRVNGGSLKYYAVNPSSKEFFGEVGLHDKDWSAWMGLAQTFNGEESAAGLTASIGALLNLSFFSGGESETLETIEERPVKRDSFDYGGESTEEKMDEKSTEKLFRDADPVRPEDKLDAQDNAATKSRMKKKRVKRKSGPTTKKLLDETEKQLEDNLKN